MGIDQLTGFNDNSNEKEGMYKVTFPRNDVKIDVGGWTMATIHEVRNVGDIHSGKR